MGLCSDGGVHSLLTHLYALLKMAKQQGVEQVFVHCFMDGRDTPPQSGAGFIQQIQQQMNDDRRRQDRVGLRPLLRHGSRQALGRIERAFDAMVLGNGEKATDPVDADEALLREGRHRRIHRAGHHRRRAATSRSD